MKAVSDCEADFRDVKGLRAWLRTEAVTAKQSIREWPTPETASLWREFVQSLERLVLRKWDIYSVELPAVWDNEPPTEGCHVRIFHNAGEHKTTICSVDLDRLGFIVPAFSHTPIGILSAKASQSRDRITVEYLGPGDLVRT